MCPLRQFICSCWLRRGGVSCSMTFGRRVVDVHIVARVVFTDAPVVAPNLDRGCCEAHPKARWRHRMLRSLSCSSSIQFCNRKCFRTPRYRHSAQTNHLNQACAAPHLARTQKKDCVNFKRKIRVQKTEMIELSWRTSLHRTVRVGRHQSVEARGRSPPDVCCRGTSQSKPHPHVD